MGNIMVKSLYEYVGVEASVTFFISDFISDVTSIFFKPHTVSRIFPHLLPLRLYLIFPAVWHLHRSVSRLIPTAM